MNAILFDIGGVVIRDRGLKRQVQSVFPEVPADRLWTLLNAAMLPACRGEASRLTCWLDLADKLGVTVPPERLLQLWDTADFVRGIEVDHDVVSLVRTLRRHYKLAVVSNTMNEHAMALRQMGIYDEFDEVILSHEVGLTKDRSEIFELALGKLQVEPHDSLFIDDYEAYVRVAAGIGLRGILFTDSPSLKQSLKDLGVLDD